MRSTLSVTIADTGPSVQAECDVAGDDTWTPLHRADGAESQALTASGAVQSREWCEAVRCTVGGTPGPTVDCVLYTEPAP